MESATRVQILEEAICISLHAFPMANALGKGMNSSLLPDLAIDK